MSTTSYITLVLDTLPYYYSLTLLLLTWPWLDADFWEWYMIYIWHTHAWSYIMYDTVLHAHLTLTSENFSQEFEILKCKYRVEYFHKWHETVPEKVTTWSCLLHMSWVMSSTCHESCLLYVVSHVSYMLWVMSLICRESCLLYVVSHVSYMSWVMSPISCESCLLYESCISMCMYLYRMGSSYVIWAISNMKHM
jgi:hypothetical protein